MLFDNLFWGVSFVCDAIFLKFALCNFVCNFVSCCIMIVHFFVCLLFRICRSSFNCLGTAFVVLLTMFSPLIFTIANDVLVAKPS